MALGVLARHQGDLAASWVRVRELHPAGPATEPGDCYFHHGIALQALAADLALDAGDPAAAEQWIAAHGRWLAWSGAVLWQADHQRLRARLAAASGDPSAARAHAEAALARATKPRQPLALLAAHRLLGELDTTDERYADAQARLAAALALADACAAPYERALTLLALAALHVAGASPEDVSAPLAEARAILTALAAAPALARADAVAYGAVARGTHRVPTGYPPQWVMGDGSGRAGQRAAVALPFGLTTREAEVLRLVAQGLPDAQVAACLSLSRRTVHAHLRTIYSKIGLASRSAATRFALDHGLA